MSDRIFLMNQGRIVQSGDAETLYTAPVDLFAAGFIGNYNLLDPDAASRLLQRPVAARLAIRPEAISLHRTASSKARFAATACWATSSATGCRCVAWNWWWTYSTAHRPTCMPMASGCPCRSTPRRYEKWPKENNNGIGNIRSGRNPDPR